MKPDVDVCEIDKLASWLKEEKVKTALHSAASKITEAIYETDAMKDVHAENGSSSMYFVGRQQGLNDALCRIYVALEECFQ